MIRLSIHLCGLGLLLTACSINLPERVPATVYSLPAPVLTESAEAPIMTGLRLSIPMTSDTLSGSRLMVRVDDGSFQVFPGARWETQIPQLWRDWLLDAFWQDGRIDGLSISSEGLQAAVELGGMLRAFNAQYSDSRTEAVIQYDVRLVDLETRTIIASQRFEVREPAQDNSAAATVQALGAAAERLARELIDWTVKEAGTSTAE